MHDLQKTIDGKWEAATKYTVRQCLAMSGGIDDLATAERVRIAWMNAGPVQAFMKNACGISSLDAMADEYDEHLKQMPAFESFSRQARKGDEPEPTPTQKQASKPPTWYQLYLTSDWWKDLRQRAREWYGGCVLCGVNENLQCHHRHYNTVGSELIRDVSILCGNHHKSVGVMLGIRVPRQCPDNVEVLLKRWGLL